MPGGNRIAAENGGRTCEDSLIVATALRHGHTVATHNKRHFEASGIPVIDPFV